MTVAEQFGRNLRMARRHAFISQEALARAAGLHRTEIGLLEKGLEIPVPTKGEFDEMPACLAWAQ